MALKLAYVNREQIEYEREMECDRIWRIEEQICIQCDTKIHGEVVYETHGDIPVCVPCAEKVFEEFPEVLEALESDD